MTKICVKQVALLFITMGERGRQIHGAVNRLLETSNRAGEQAKRCPNLLFVFQNICQNQYELPPNLGSCSLPLPTLMNMTNVENFGKHIYEIENEIK